MDTRSREYYVPVGDDRPRSRYSGGGSSISVQTILLILIACLSVAGFGLIIATYSNMPGTAKPTDLTGIAGSIATLSSHISNQDSNIFNLLSKITAQDSKMNALQQLITDKTGLLKQTLDGQGSALSSINGAVGSQSTLITSVLSDQNSNLQTIINTFESVTSEKKSYKPVEDYSARTVGDYDFIFVGAGTGGLAAASRLGGAAYRSGNTDSMLIMEAGRWIEPAMKTLSYSLTHNGVTENHKISVPQNWPVAIDAWIAQYYGNPLSDGTYPMYAFGIMNPYEYNDGTARFNSAGKSLLEVLKTLRDDFFDQVTAHPNTAPSYTTVDTLPNAMTFELATNVDLTGGNGPPYGQTVWFPAFKNAPNFFTENNGNWSFTGNPIILMDPAWGDFKGNQFLQGYGNTEDLFFYEAQYSNNKQTYVQNYPRGKSIGGSSLSNAQIHYGFTDKVLTDLANAVNDPTWNSARVYEIVNNANTLTAKCDYTLGANIPNDCLGPVFGVPAAGYSDPSFMLPDTETLVPLLLGILGIPYNGPAPGVDAVWDALHVDYPYNPKYMISEFEDAKRQLGYIHTISVNPFSKRHAGSHDVIANLIGLGIPVCFKPTPFPRILSKWVMPDALNCDVSHAKIQIQTGALVTGLTFDDTEAVSRVTGVEWVYEAEQVRPDQNRYLSNSGRECSPSENILGDKYGGSLYGNGLPNTGDCKNFYNTLEAMAGKTDAQKEEIRARSLVSAGELTYYGLDDTTIGRATFDQRHVPNAHTLPALQQVKSVTAKKEVVLSAGAPATVTMLIRSGISQKSDHLRLNTPKLRSELETGYMADNFEGIFTLAPAAADPVTLLNFAIDIFDNQGILVNSIFKSFLRNDIQWNISKYWTDASYYNNMRNILRTHEPTGYDMNTHYFRNLLPTLGSQIYSARANSFAMNTLKIRELGLPMSGPCMLSEVTGKRDILFKNVRMEVKSTHPLERISWKITTAANKERCSAVKQNLLDLLHATQRTYPHVPFEYIQLTQRAKPLEFFIEKGSISHTDLWSGDATINVTQYNAYFDNTTNPIIGGLGFDDDDRSFCDLYNVRLSGHHIMGGAMMGSPTDEMAVTDSRGRVYGVKGLRVSDSSLMPVATSGNPWVSIFQAGNVIGNFMAEEWGYDLTDINKNSNPITNVNHPYYKSNLVF